MTMKCDFSAKSSEWDLIIRISNEDGVGWNGQLARSGLGFLKEENSSILA